MSSTSIDVACRSLFKGNRTIKEIFDRLFAFFALVQLSPIFLILALIIKLTSPGPVFFKQLRLGRDGMQFNIYKFRSMYVHNEDGKLTQAKKNDARITKVGAFLRRSSLDELPQFINVLLGHMSVVGPRPHALEHDYIYSELVDGYLLRQVVKPGITGWAQVNGWRGETDTLEKMARRIEYDLFYIKNWSLLFDLKIIWRTVLSGWRHASAY